MQKIKGIDIKAERKRIDSLDHAIAVLIKNRQQRAVKIIEAKKKAGVEFTDIKRELEVFQNYAATLDSDILALDVTAAFFTHSKRR